MASSPAARANTTDELYIESSPISVYRAVIGLSETADWWPGARAGGGYGWVTLDVPVTRARGRMNFKASIPDARDGEAITWTLEEGALRGRGEWWFEAFKEGTVVHYYLDVERAPGTRRRLSSAVRRHRWGIRRGLNALKDVLEGRVSSARG
jgi:hypothetical protein